MTKIEWTHRPGTRGVSWNPLRARNKATGGMGHYCVKVSPGCEHCYAERMQPRFTNPIRYAAQDLSLVKGVLDERALAEPLHWRAPRTVFVCSMSDLFGEWVPDAWIDRVFAVMALAPHHTFIVLTKRPERMTAYLAPARAHPVGLAALDQTFESIGKNPKSRVGERVMLTGDIAHLAKWPLPNVWPGVSVEDQRRADERIPLLLDTPAAVRFISAEPLLSAILLTFIPAVGRAGWLTPLSGEHQLQPAHADHRGAKLDWVIAGGESGPGARPMHPDWARSLRDQCAAAGVPFFFKQWGEWAPAPPTTSWSDHEMVPPSLKTLWSSGDTSLRLGKHRAGRLLDGREWSHWPA